MEQFRDLKHITQRYSLGKSRWYQLIQEGMAPKPVKIGRSSRWTESSLEKFEKHVLNEVR